MMLAIARQPLLIESAKGKDFLGVARYLMDRVKTNPEIGCFFCANRLGEPSVNFVAPAIADAVLDAFGGRSFDLPLTPKNVVRAIKRKEPK
jgi:hypothetical protein